jgi:putative nucleotidyltransferase with HDIG domain
LNEEFLAGMCGFICIDPDPQRIPNLKETAMQATSENTPIRFDKNFEMPSIPVVLTKIIQVLDDSTSSARDLEELILHDPSLSARILKLANSAFYSFRSEVKTISHAIPLLGMNLVKSLAIGVNIFESFIKGMKSEAALIHKLWMHSFAVGVLSQEIWRAHGSRKDAEFAFLCGLLHDLGKVVFFRKDAARYSEMFSRAKTENDPEISAMETEAFGADHATIGAMLATHWHLPAELADVIHQHHDNNLNSPSIVAAVSLADVVAKQTGIGYDGDCKIERVPGLTAALGMTAEDYEALVQNANERRKDIEDFFKLT